MAMRRRRFIAQESHFVFQDLGLIRRKKEHSTNLSKYQKLASIRFLSISAYSARYRPHRPTPTFQQDVLVGVRHFFPPSTGFKKLD
ncbi:hypothetical protein KOW79_018864 [Hemibagrus wyckioides]|uniref:Uncharacterized protein n=1 Tax=Hemibagrus wyckioides TaxID=337641 RepID=A0A9D3N8G4_9TELE|nr:hypothetical protein KOW79_018864 [Hemibagrus wyckioides]